MFEYFVGIGSNPQGTDFEWSLYRCPLGSQNPQEDSVLVATFANEQVKKDFKDHINLRQVRWQL